jgi:PhnB protein
MQLSPFLLFDGNCAEAMQHYQRCLGGELSMTRVSDMPNKDQMPPELHGRLAYSHLKSGAIEISATDWLHQTRRPLQGNTVAMYLHLGTYDELREAFDKLAEGGDPELRDELREMPFGTYGHLVDKFGVNWFFQGESTATTAE